MRAWPTGSGQGRSEGVARPLDLGGRAIAELGLPPAVEAALRDVIGGLGADYREAFVTMVQAINRQAAALERIQTTLNVLVSKVAPELSDQALPALGVAPEGTRPDLASAIIVSDPIATGYVLSQEALARALGIKQTDLSILERAFKLRDDGKCAIVVRRGVRRGKPQDTVNFHPRAIERFRELVATAQPSTLDGNQRSALERIRKAFANSPVEADAGRTSEKR
jgi:hypothetical protein